MDIRDFAMDFFSLAGRKASVTGGNTGLGQAFTLALRQRLSRRVRAERDGRRRTTGPLGAEVAVATNS